MSDLQLVEKLTSVVRIQSEVINEIFQLLMQHISAEEADALQVTQKINRAAEIMKEVQ
jgi:predicted nucleic acid-binding protein